MKTGASLNKGHSKQDYGTPPEFVWAVEERFGKIQFDLAASKSNALAPDFFCKEQDSLKQDWHNLNGLLWLNPPFGDIAPWVEKCSEESMVGAIIIMLTPASVGSNWFRYFVFQQAQVIFLNGRIKFIGAEDAFPKDCMLTIWRRNILTDFSIWTWKRNAKKYPFQLDPTMVR